MVILAMTTFAPYASTQEGAGTGRAAGSPTEIKRSGSDEPRLPEAELVWSTSFRSASLVQPLRGDLNIEGHYFAGNENNVGYTAGSWTFHGENWKIAPGFGVAFGDNGFRTMPALSVRWAYERSWFVTEGLLVQGLLHTNFYPEGTEPEAGSPTGKSVVPSIADGNHISARWKRLTAGGTWEHMEFREGREWKGGVRVAYQVSPPLSLTFFAMVPGAEIRGGILFQPEEKARSFKQPHPQSADGGNYQ
jgi:hypothetical protein